MHQYITFRQYNIYIYVYIYVYIYIYIYIYIIITSTLRLSELNTVILFETEIEIFAVISQSDCFQRAVRREGEEAADGSGSGRCGGFREVEACHAPRQPHEDVT